MPAAPSQARRIVDIALDEESVARRTPEVEHERAVAMFDLLEENDFVLVERRARPYKLHIGVFEKRLVFGVHAADDRKLRDIILSLTPFRKVVKDYFLICESYYAAIRSSSPSQIEALDMGRRGLHNEGSELLRERLAGKIEIDLDTARRLFTLICALHITGMRRGWRACPSVLFACSHNACARRWPRRWPSGSTASTRLSSIRSASMPSRARRLRRRGDRRDRHRPHAPSRQDLRRPGRTLLRPGRVAVARGAAPRAGIDPQRRRPTSNTGRSPIPALVEGSREARLDAYRRGPRPLWRRESPSASAATRPIDAGQVRLTRIAARRLHGATSGPSM